MCGIVGYIGNKDVVPILISGLKRLEYRGYDSAGIAIFDNNKLNVLKSKGRLKILEEKLAEKIYELSGCIRSANKHRQMLYSQDRTKTTGSADIFFHELKNAQKLLNGINALYSFE